MIYHRKTVKPHLFLKLLSVLFIFFISVLFITGCKKESVHFPNSLRAPAYPLISIDTYINGWLFGDTLYQHQITHSTGRELPLFGILRVDGEVFRFMGIEENTITDYIAPASEQDDWEGKYTFVRPDKNWTGIDYNDDDWDTGPGAFGYFDDGRFNVIRTPWKTEDIWVRREIVLEEDLAGKSVYLHYSNDDDAEIYINGIKVVDTGNVVKYRERVRLSDEVISALRKGKNIIAAHCTNRLRNAVIDVGLSVAYPVPPAIRQTAIQKSVEVQPTQTIYNFTCGPVDMKLTFTAPLLMNDLELLSRPVNYITYEIISNDSRDHEVELYFEANNDWALAYQSQESISEKFEKDGLVFLKTGSVKQNILGKTRTPHIDWGYFYLASDKENTYIAAGDYRELRTLFCSEGIVKDALEEAPDKQKRLAISKSLAKVKDKTSGFVMLGYDEIYSVQYFGKNLRPYWNRSGDKKIEDIFIQAQNDYTKIRELCDKFDVELMKYGMKCGGREYAELCALAYRQTLTAHKLLVAPNDELLYLSNSVIKTATVDVTYPSAPLFLLYNVDLLKGMLNPIFYYVESGRWNKLFAPHDIGDYPHANGETSDYYRLPVEESGNMLILAAAIATMEGNATYAERHWNTLSQWADFLFNEGFDPEYQFNTDIFAGGTEHDTNLSIKAILGLASYARLADMLGKNEIAKKFSAEARSLSLRWTTLANDGDHYRMAFDQPDTWSQKYNLVWDKIMKIDVFPHEVRGKEVAYYLTRQNEYGLPLDSRHLYTKADWIMWSAALSPNTETFRQFITPLHKFVNETPARKPLPDWYWTNDPKRVEGFSARPVVGAFFIKMMEDKLINK